MKKIFTLFCAICLLPNFSAYAWIGGPFSGNSFFGAGGDDGVYEAAATAVNGIGLFRIVVGNEFNGVNPTGVQSSGSSQQQGGLLATTFEVTGVQSGNVVIGSYASGASNVWFFEGLFYSGRTYGTASSTLGIVQGIAEAGSSIVVEPVGIAATDNIAPGPPVPPGAPVEPVQGVQGVAGNHPNDNIPSIPGIPGQPGPPGQPGSLPILGSPEVPQDLSPLFNLNSSFTASFHNRGPFLPSRTFSGTGRGLRTTHRGTPLGSAFNFTVFGSKVSNRITLGL
jgi:hypothetical protein